MIRIHVARPKCGRKDLSPVNSSLFLCVAAQICGEYTFICSTKKYVTRIVCVPLGRKPW